MIVAKFGGTSVSTPEQIKTICLIARNVRKKNPILVVSALSGVTDLLISLAVGKDKKNLQTIRSKHKALITGIFGKESADAKELFTYIDFILDEIASCTKKKASKALQDKIVSFGEIMSSYIIASVLAKEGLPAKQVIATELIVTDSSFGNAEFFPEETKRKTSLVLKQLIDKEIIPVVTGFIGATLDGRTTTLGRGGSDYSASIIGYSMNASEIQIWTDVDGIMTADPRIVKNARTVKIVSYDEASELAILGAKVLHPKTILPAIKENIPVRILNTFNPENAGTTILKKVNKSNSITSIAYKKGIKLIDIYTPSMFLMYGFLHKIFKIFDELAISVDFVSTSETSISLTIDGKYDTERLTEKLAQFAEITVKNNHATVSVIGKPPGIMPVIPGMVYTLLEKKNINVEMISAGASKINETIVVKGEDADETVKILHERLIINGGNAI